MLPKQAEVRPGDHHTVVYCCRSADYVLRVEYHDICIRAALAVRCKIVKCPIEAVKATKKRTKYVVLTYSEALLYD
jgi:hypothetical protein